MRYALLGRRASRKEAYPEPIVIQVVFLSLRAMTTSVHKINSEVARGLSCQDTRDGAIVNSLLKSFPKATETKSPPFDLELRVVQKWHILVDNNERRYGV